MNAEAITTWLSALRIAHNSPQCLIVQPCDVAFAAACREQKIALPVFELQTAALLLTACCQPERHGEPLPGVPCSILIMNIAGNKIHT